MSMHEVNIRVADVLATIDRNKRTILAEHARENDLSRYTLAAACREADEDYRQMARLTNRGNPTMRSVVRLAGVLNVGVPELVDSGGEG